MNSRLAASLIKVSILALTGLAGVAGLAGDRAALAQPASKPAPPPPPSTGREMPKATSPDLGPEQAAKVIEAAVKRSSKDANCNEVVDDLQAAVPFARLNKAAAGPVYLAMQRCAIKTKRWNAVIRATTTLLRIDPNRASPDELVKALVELGRYEDVPPAIKALLKQFPGSARELTTALTYALCRQERWAECAKVSQQALASLAKANVAQGDEAMVKNRIAYAQALVGIGDLAGFAAERAALAKLLGDKAAPLEALDARAQAAGKLRAWLRIVPAQKLPLGTYHFFGKKFGKKETGALLTLRMVSHEPKERVFRLEAEVPGATERATRTFKAAKGKLVEQSLTPPLQLDFEVRKVRAPRPAQLAWKLVELTGGKERVLFDETPALEVLPRDYLPTKRHLGADERVFTPENFAAWITPNVPEVEDVLSKAKARLEDRTFAGEQRATLPQVRALYDELKARGVSYVMDPQVMAEQLSVQRTRLPAEVITSTNAQCLEGTLLFATLLESVGLRPIVVLVPGHAFVGWWTTRKDGKKVPARLFLETTSVGTAPFEYAVSRATERIQEETAAGNLANGVVQLVDVASLRKLGFTPQPTE